MFLPSILVDVRLSEPGTYRLEISAPSRLVVILAGGSGGEGSGFVDGEESSDGTDGQDSKLLLTSEESNAEVVAFGAKGGKAGTIEAERETGEEAEVAIEILNIEEHSYVTIDIGQGGRGGFVTGQHTSADGMNGKHGFAKIYAFRSNVSWPKEVR